MSLIGGKTKKKKKAPRLTAEQQQAHDEEKPTPPVSPPRNKGTTLVRRRYHKRRNENNSLRQIKRDLYTPETGSAINEYSNNVLDNPNHIHLPPSNPKSNRDNLKYLISTTVAIFITGGLYMYYHTDPKNSAQNILKREMQHSEHYWLVEDLSVEKTLVRNMFKAYNTDLKAEYELGNYDVATKSAYKYTIDEYIVTPKGSFASEVARPTTKKKSFKKKLSFKEKRAAAARKRRADQRRATYETDYHPKVDTGSSSGGGTSIDFQEVLVQPSYEKGKPQQYSPTDNDDDDDAESMVFTMPVRNFHVLHKLKPDDLLEAANEVIKWASQTWQYEYRDASITELKEDEFFGSFVEAKFSSSLLSAPLQWWWGTNTEGVLNLIQESIKQQLTDWETNMFIFRSNGLFKSVSTVYTGMSKLGGVFTGILGPTKPIISFLPTGYSLSTIKSAAVTGWFYLGVFSIVFNITQRLFELITKQSRLEEAIAQFASSIVISGTIWVVVPFIISMSTLVLATAVAAAPFAIMWYVLQMYSTPGAIVGLPLQALNLLRKLIFGIGKLNNDFSRDRRTEQNRRYTEEDLVDEEEEERAFRRWQRREDKKSLRLRGRQDPVRVWSPKFREHIWVYPEEQLNLVPKKINSASAYILSDDDYQGESSSRQIVIHHGHQS